MITNQEIMENISLLLREKDLKSSLEILANALVSLGVGYLPEDVCNNIPDNTPEFIKFIIDYRKVHGESLATACIFNGLTTLLWLEG